MDETNASIVAVTVNVLPALEERVVDWLLSRDAPGFTSYAAHGHGATSAELSIAEQVSGRQRRVEFRIEVAAAALEAFLDALAADFAGTDLYFLVSPLLRSGHLRGIVNESVFSSQ
jgi:hypothetical protein